MKCFCELCSNAYPPGEGTSGNVSPSVKKTLATFLSQVLGEKDGDSSSAVVVRGAAEVEGVSLCERCLSEVTRATEMKEEAIIHRQLFEKKMRGYEEAMKNLQTSAQNSTTPSSAEGSAGEIRSEIVNVVRGWRKERVSHLRLSTQVSAPPTEQDFNRPPTPEEEEDDVEVQEIVPHSVPPPYRLKQEVVSDAVQSLPDDSDVEVADVVPESIPPRYQLKREAIDLEESVGSSPSRSQASSSSRKMPKKINVEPKVSCLFCEKGFPKYSHLEEHMNGHSGERPYQCDLCPKNYSTPSNLSKHKHVHERFPCSICDKTFTQKRSLEGHENWHRGEKPYKCPLCEVAFHSAKNLGDHKRRVHAQETNPLLSKEALYRRYKGIKDL